MLNAFPLENSGSHLSGDLLFSLGKINPPVHGPFRRIVRHQVRLFHDQPPGGLLVPLSAPVIKCKKTPRKKCRFMAERRKKDRLPKGRKKRAERESGNERRSMDGHTK